MARRHGERRSAAHGPTALRLGTDVAVLLSEMPSFPIQTTMLELVCWLSRFTDDDREVVVRATRLVNGGVVVLRGNFAGRRID